MIQITAIRIEKGEAHQSILAFQWHELGKDVDTKESPLSTMVKFIEKSPKKVLVRKGNKAVEVRVVEAPTKYVQSYEEEHWTNELLELPRF